jgi:hypothetical protein
LFFVPYFYPPYAVDVSIPYTTTLNEGVAVGVDTTKYFPASITMPVRSNTPFATSAESYSIYSAVAGVAELDTAILICAEAELDLLTMFTDITENVLAGTVYTVVSAVDVILAVPNLPVAIIISPC